MAWEQRLAGVFGLDDARWARHANPLSGWSRAATGIPLIILAGWSRVWIGWWSLLVAALVVVWLWLNPRLFPPPQDDRAWMTRGVLGERLWARRDRLAVPEARTRLPHVLNVLAGLGALSMIYGLVVLAPGPTFIGAAIAFGSKMLFISRMAALYDSAAARDPTLAYRTSR